MVPETPPMRKHVELGLRSNHPYSASPQLITTQLICIRIGVNQLTGAQGALSGDVWILSWGGVRVLGGAGLWGR